MVRQSELRLCIDIQAFQPFACYSHFIPTYFIFWCCSALCYTDYRISWDRKSLSTRDWIQATGLSQKETRWLITNQDLFFFSDHMTSSIDQKYTFCLLSESHYVTLMRWETRAKWKLLSKLISIVWSICLKCHSNCCLVFIIQSLKLWNIKLPEAYYIESQLCDGIYDS